MNRIIGANLVTTAVHVIVTITFVKRMPITYYIIGGLLQLGFMVCSRFGYRVLLVEKRKIQNRHGEKIRAIVVGSGENGRRVLKSLEESETYRPVAVVGTGTMMDGIPIYPFSDLSSVIRECDELFIADPLITAEERSEIKRVAEGREVHEYTGFFSNLGGRLSLTELLATIHTPLTVEIEGKKQEYESGEDALQFLTEPYEVREISGMIELKLEKRRQMNTRERLQQAYEAYNSPPTSEARP